MIARSRRSVDQFSVYRNRVRAGLCLHYITFMSIENFRNSDGEVYFKVLFLFHMKFPSYRMQNYTKLKNFMMFIPSLVSNTISRDKVYKIQIS
jgi:hypothetical protein